MAAKLILTHDGNTIGEFELGKESMTIGRKPENDIQIDNLAVSGQHAKIITILNDSFLEDMNSTNGTYVNGTLVKKHALQDGDTVTIGKHQLKYVNKEASVGGDDFEKALAYVQQAQVSFSLRGGTTEILRGVIARGLGLR